MHYCHLCPWKGTWLISSVLKCVLSTESNIHKYNSVPSYKARPLHKGQKEKEDDISPKNGHLDNKLTLLLGEGWQGSRRAEAGSATLHS